MQKTDAIAALGGSIQSVADAIGISYTAVYKWPDPLTARIADRVEAAIARRAAALVAVAEQLKQARKAKKVSK